MYKTTLIVNPSIRNLSTENIVPSQEDFTLYANYKLAMKVREQEASEEDLADYEYNQKDFINVVCYHCNPQERDKIIDNLKDWEKDCSDSINWINNTWQIFLNYYHLKPNIIEYDKYDKENYAPDYDYIELLNTRNLLRELNSKIAELFVISE
ncbi:hypothetical protein NIES267_73530 (plasmid) [Calothrix parasitica NIES-267]|uniref:Uncharacterized protein n=1 Tax=Calothrix parasitica NIES-267 TaxID=1973488 RepID=A0A1Z4M2X4_9CYAN|nr:hypothetical protein NIES267_73530 [Calothrix parasitica NIES-267]